MTARERMVIVVVIMNAADLILVRNFGLVVVVAVVVCVCVGGGGFEIWVYGPIDHRRLTTWSATSLICYDAGLSAIPWTGSGDAIVHLYVGRVKGGAQLLILSINGSDLK